MALRWPYMVPYTGAIQCNDDGYYGEALRPSWPYDGYYDGHTWCHTLVPTIQWPYAAMMPTLAL